MSNLRVEKLDEHESPTVTIVIPCYNLGRYLEETVESVLGQTRDDFEIVIVDDGSTDTETRALLDGYERPKTRVLRTENRGLAAARNLGAAESEAPFLCFLDADDRLRPRFCERTLAVLESEPDLHFCSCWLENFGIREGLWQPERCDLAQLLAECTVLTASPVRREAFEAVGGFDEEMPIAGYEDWELWIRLVAAAYPGTILREVLFDYRRRPGSMSAVCCSEQGHEILFEYMVKKHRTVFEQNLNDILALKEEEIGSLLRENADAQRKLSDWLEPERRSLELEAERLERRARTESKARPEDARLEQRLAELERSLDHQAERARSAEAALDQRIHEVSRLRGSMSWRVTKPLRSIWGLALKLRGSS